RNRQEGCALRRRPPRAAAEADQAAPGGGGDLRQGRPQRARRAGARRDRDHQGVSPAQMSDTEAEAAIAEAVKATGATSIKDMGKVMAALKQAHTGKMDFGKASGMVKAVLSAPGG